MNIIYKYDITEYSGFYAQAFTLNLNEGWEFFKVGIQEDRVVFWTNNITTNQQEYQFMIVGTGVNYQGVWKYLDTYQLGSYVGHLLLKLDDNHPIIQT